MSLVARITALAQAVGADIKALSASMLDVAGSRRMTGPVRFAAAPEVVLNNGQLDLAAATSNSVRGRIDGPILDLGSLPAGEVRTVRFLGGGSTAKLVYSYASIRLPANADISLSEGDTAEFYSLAPGTWELRFFQRQDGTALVGTAAPVSSVAGKTGVVTLAKGDVGLGNVDNTADSAKPVSTAQATAIAAKITLAQAMAQLQSLGIGGVVPTITDANLPSGTQFAVLSGSGLNLPIAAYGALWHHQALTTAASQFFNTTTAGRLFNRTQGSSVWNAWREVAFTDNPALTGAPTAPTPAVGSNTNQLQTTAGALAQMQAFGLGLPIAGTVEQVSDANTALVTGTFRMANGGLNKPSTRGGTLDVKKSFANTLVQLYYPSSTSEQWLRTTADSGATWSTWDLKPSNDQPAFTTSLQCAGPVKVGQYTLATLPSASAFNGYEIDVTNATVAPAGPKRCRSNGTNWLILNTNTPVS